VLIQPGNGKRTATGLPIATGAHYAYVCSCRQFWRNRNGSEKTQADRSQTKKIPDVAEKIPATGAQAEIAQAAVAKFAQQGIECLPHRGRYHQRHGPIAKQARTASDFGNRVTICSEGG